MGLQPVYLDMVQAVPSRPTTIRRERTLPQTQRMLKYYLDPNPWQKRAQSGASRSANLSPEQTEEQNQKLVEAVEQHLYQMRRKLAAGLVSEHISPEFADDVGKIVQCLDINVQMALNNGGQFFSLSGLLKMLQVPENATTWLEDFKDYGKFALMVAKFTDRTIRCIGTSHVQFGAIGKEAKRILDSDYTYDKLALNCGPSDNVLFGLGAHKGGGQSIRQLIAKVKNEKISLSLNLKSVTEDVANANAANAAANQNNIVALTKLSLDKPLGKDMKCVLEIPYPSYNGTFAIRGVFPYVVCAGGIGFKTNPAGPGLNRVPVLDVSTVLCIKYFGVGVQFELTQGRLSSTFGMSFRTKLLAVGLTRKRPGHYNATFCKELVDSSTTIAAQASYSPYPAENQGPPEAGVIPGFRFYLGLKHAIDPTLYCKARIGTEGASVLVKKSNSSGMWSVQGGLHVDFADPWRSPKMGVTWSFRR